MNCGSENTLNCAARTFLVLLRIAIGWHFLYEGCYKFEKQREALKKQAEGDTAVAKGWSSAGYLKHAQGPFAERFREWAKNPQTVDLLDNLVIAGLIGCGLSLMLGLFTRVGCLGVIAMLMMFYISAPPWNFVQLPAYAVPGEKPIAPLLEGSYLIVNKNLIEALAAAALLFAGTGQMAGLDILIRRFVTGPVLGFGSAPATSGSTQVQRVEVTQPRPVPAPAK